MSNLDVLGGDADLELGRVHGVDLCIARTSRPWELAFEAVALSAGPAGGMGGLGHRYQDMFPDAPWHVVEFGQLNPDSATLVRIPAPAPGALACAVVLSVRDRNRSATEWPEGPVTLGSVQRATVTAVRVAAEQRARSLLLPLLGAGAAGMAAGEVAAAMMPAVESALRDLPAAERPETIGFLCRDDATERAVRRAWAHRDLLRLARRRLVEDRQVLAEARSVGLTEQDIAALLDLREVDVWRTCAKELEVLRGIEDRHEHALVLAQASRDGLLNRERQVAAERVADAVLQLVFLPLVRLEISQRQRERGREQDLMTRRAEFRRPLGRVDARQLRRPPSREAVVDTAAKAQLFDLIDPTRSARASVGVAGPRGCGKSTLLREVYEGWTSHGIRILVPAPASYAPREFLLYLYGQVCRKVLGTDTADSGDRRGQRPGQLRSTSLVTLIVVPAVVGLVGACLAAVAMAAAAPLSRADVAWMGAGVAAVAAVAMLVSYLHTAPRWRLPGRRRLLAGGVLVGGLTALAPYAPLPARASAGAVLIAAALVTSVRWIGQPPGGPSRASATAATGLAAAQLLGILLGAALLALPAATPVPPALAGIGALLAAAGCGALATGARWHRWIAAEIEAHYAPPDDPLSRRARRDLARISYQTTVLSGWSGAVKLAAPGWLPFGVDAGASGGTSEADQPLGVPDIVQGIKDLLPARGPALVAIDELDKIESVEKARDFLNEIKGILDADGAYVLVSMSEDAIASFERRGLPFRDVFDSAFDDVVRTSHLPWDQGFRLLGSRLTDVPPQYFALAYCLSGGLPRDMVRAADRILSTAAERDRPPALPAVVHHVVHRDLDGKTEAVTGAITSITIEPEVSSILRCLQDLDGCAAQGPCITDAGWLDRIGKLGPVLRDGAPDVQQRRDLVRLTVELLGYAYYCRTLVELFQVDSDQQVDRLMRIVDEDGGRVLNRLARARQTFAVNPFVAWDALSAIREETRLAPCPLPAPFVASRPAQ